MDLFVDPTRPRALSRSLYDQIRAAIGSGRLLPGERLPSSRRLADDLGVARQTIATVYGRLAAEGHVVGRGAAGTFVADEIDVETAGAEGRRSPRGRGAPPTVLEPRVGLPAPLVASETPRFDLRSGSPDLALFPHVPWRRAALAAAHRAPTGYGDHAGLPELRRALARRLARTRGVIADPEQIVVTTGAQAAIDLTIRLLTRPGDVVAVEEPGYPPVRRLIESLDRRVALVPVDADGIRPDLVPADARLVYTTPSHQSPTGATLTVARRRALLAHADRHRQAIVEDDYDSEHRHSDRPLEPLHLLDTTGRVVYVATFSKTLAPSIRLGCAVFPLVVAPHAVALRAATDVQPSDLVQLAIHHLVTSGDLDRHLRRTRKIYARRHEQVADWVARMSADGHLTAWATDHAGLHVAVRLHGITEAALAARLDVLGVRLGSYRDTWVQPPDHEGAVIGFGNADAERLDEALGLVERALTGVRAR
ncbi:MAG: PLP-dependent aminotransferase family protein [Acidimicrobiales bacterium]|nr:PLP-dependent aminotransferase family protein [Acidimicrobiales bacterium]MCB9393329.1 PLP-dependent aminotransferase family protein [Acidimicrobiaceae bacterium]